MRESTTRELTAAQQQTTAKAQQERLVNDWEKKAAKADAKYDDFDTVVGDLKPTNPLVMAIMQADNGADIAYYLGSHVKEAHRIASLDPVSQVREIGRLEARLLAEPPKPKVSSAPAPIAPVSGSAGAPTDQLTAEDAKDTKRWLEKRNRQVHGR